MNLQHKIINHVLTQNEWMKDELIQFKNKIIQLQVEPFTLQFKVNDLGQLVSCDIQEHVDTTISLTSQAFISMVVTKQKKGITVSGDVDLANIFSKIMLKARWDYEEDLSYLVGDIAAINSGELIFVTGSSGAGKSTLIKLISALVITINAIN